MEIWKFDETNTYITNPDLTADRLNDGITGRFGMFLVDSDFCLIE